jgi:hypothetical protein
VLYASPRCVLRDERGAFYRPRISVTPHPRLGDDGRELGASEAATGERRDEETGRRGDGRTGRRADGEAGDGGR